MEYETQVTLGRNDTTFDVIVGFGLDQIDNSIDFDFVAIELNGKRLTGKRYNTIYSKINLDEIETSIYESFM